MKWLLPVALCIAACKPKEVPFQPPPKEDAGARPIDAAPPPDAPAEHAVSTATKIVAGDHTSCALMTDATLRCWGRNDAGQLGNGTRADAATPVMPNLHGVKDIVLGAAHACALLDDESVTCWGRINFKGHVRLSGGERATRVPTPARGLDHVAALTANGALKEDGTVWFWGTDGVPVRTGLTDVIEIASAGADVCGLRRDGSVACAGPATWCEAAAPKTAPAKAARPKPPRRGKRAKSRQRRPAAAAPKPATPALLPIEVLRLPAARHLAFDVGLCVVTRTGTLQCLQASDGCKLDSPWPGLARVDYVTDNCARIADGSARCWSVDTRSRVVRKISGVTGALAIAASSTHACALLGDRTVSCWGSNASGALGRGTADTQAHREASPVTF